jgi:cytochrome P450
MKSVRDYSFGDRNTIACPYDYYKAMRLEDPVHFDEIAGSYIVSRYEDIKQALAQPLIFSSGLGFKNQKRQDFSDEIDEFYRSKGLPKFEIIVNSDPPYHTRIRSLMEKAFTAHRVATMEGYISDIANILIDGFIGEGEIDFVARFAMPLPIYVIADQLGIPRSHFREFKRWSDASVAPLGRQLDRERALWCAEQTVEMWHYINARIEERRAAPFDDMIYDLVHARIDDPENPVLTRLELFEVVRSLIVAGNETTTTAIGNGMLVLLKDPDLVEKLLATIDDDRMFSRLTEEILRLEAPVQGLPRMTTQDTELAGCKIPKGSLVYLGYASGNRDAAKFDDPDGFSLERKNAGQHLAFGSGIHRCIGAMLSRMEIKVAMRLLIKRLDRMKLTIPESELVYTPSMVIRPLVSLPMSFTKRES